MYFKRDLLSIYMLLSLLTPSLTDSDADLLNKIALYKQKKSQNYLRASTFALNANLEYIGSYFRKEFTKQLEETNWIFDFMNVRKFDVTLSDFSQKESKWGNLRDVFHDIYKNELRLSKLLKRAKTKDGSVKLFLTSLAERQTADEWKIFSLIPRIVSYEKEGGPFIHLLEEYFRKKL